MRKIKVLLLCGILSLSSLVMGATPSVKELIESGNVNPWNIEQVKKQYEQEKAKITGQDYINDFNAILTAYGNKTVCYEIENTLNTAMKIDALTKEYFLKFKGNADIKKLQDGMIAIRDSVLNTGIVKTDKAKAMIISYQQMCTSLSDFFRYTYEGNYDMAQAMYSVCKNTSVTVVNATYFLADEVYKASGNDRRDIATFKKVNGIK